MVKDRGSAVGLPELHPHQLRHTFSHDWLASQRWFRRRPNASCRLEVPRHAKPLRGKCSPRARPRRPPPAIPRGSVLAVSLAELAYQRLGYVGGEEVQHSLNPCESVDGLKVQCFEPCLVRDELVYE